MVLAQKQTYQWNRIECPETNPHTHGQSSTKERRRNKGEQVVSSASGVGKTGQPHVNQ